MIHTLELPKPHSWQQRMMLYAFMTPGLRGMAAACGTKFGKSYGVSGGMSAGAWIKKEATYRWGAPIYSQTKIGMDYFLKNMPKDMLEINRSGDPSLTIRHNRTRIEFKSAKNPMDWEGSAIDGGYGLDEYAKMNPHAFTSARTTVTVTEAPIVAFSTPLGKNHFYTLWMDWKDRMERSLKKGEPPEYIAITAPTWANPHVPRESILDAKQQLPERIFNQLYGAEFLDNGDVFLNVRQCVYGEPLDGLRRAGLEGWTHYEAKNMKVVVGADWAKTSDHTVFIALQICEGHKPRVVGFTRIQGMGYLDQVQELQTFCDIFGDTQVCWHDKTGVGVAIDDMLSYINVNTRGITFSNTRKSDMVQRLMLTFERKGVEIPDWPVMIKELDMFEVRVNKLGTTVYSHPVGGHDDTVCALMLANAAAEEYGTEFKFRLLENLGTKKEGLEDYYTELIEDEED